MAVAEGLILDPEKFKNEGNIDMRPPEGRDFEDEFQCVPESECSATENHPNARVVIHPSQCRVFETCNHAEAPPVN